ncbi:Type I restriction-modification system, restriction subunit R [Methanosarcina siciliae T4/M]|uniref:Type I restriction-modification system, restriction subunit R n=2 Tax=Methanosarcina siciliae TaxID=38027 RepID=A0A0E3LAH4_9EURY|nr:type I restriction endonuclease [Methanosarcina siciliae]AKB28097.1 Type I restriction-modification system, restriction subunit R [Methanosarcina siciliae T4/M]AKB32026.1 Type I restriction-modification system, restriction subunit R [Methanosarcina siciliae HI350]
MPLKIKNQTKKKGEIPIPAIIPESEVEAASLEILSELGYDYLYGPDIAPETEDAEREDFGIVILLRRLRTAVDRLNPKIPAGAKRRSNKKGAQG